jgi:hypothetical protein
MDGMELLLAGFVVEGLEVLEEDGMYCCASP